MPMDMTMGYWWFLLYMTFYFYTLTILLFLAFIYFFVDESETRWYIRLLWEDRTFKYQVIIANAIIFIVIAICLYFLVPYYNLVAFANAVNLHAVWLMWIVILLLLQLERF